MSDTITITLPLPDAGLSPNARVHWAKLAKLKKVARAHGFGKASDQLFAVRGSAISCAWRQREWGFDFQASNLIPFWPAATIHYTFYFKTERKRDDDNLIYRMKAARDGIAAAGLVPDDNKIQTLPPTIKIDKKNPRVVVTLAKQGDGR